MKFLGYCPYEEARTLGNRLRLQRPHLGLSYRELAKMLGVPALSVGGRRVRGDRIGGYKGSMERFLTDGDSLGALGPGLPRG